MDIDLEELAALMALLKDKDFAEFRYEKGDLRIIVRRGELPEPANLEVADDRSQAEGGRNAPARYETPPPAPPAQHTDGQVLAPLPGTFYRSPKPGAPPFVDIGDVVEPETVVCIVEVMKLMQSVTAGQRGRISEIHAADGEVVDEGTPLFTLLPVEE